MADRIIVNRAVLRRQATRIQNVASEFVPQELLGPDLATTISANRNSQNAYALAQNNFSGFGEALYQAANNILLTSDYFTDLDNQLAGGMDQ
jgi:type VII secretion effector (TIGR04197 family)